MRIEATTLTVEVDTVEAEVGIENEKTPHVINVGK